MNLPFLKKDIFKASREMPATSPIHQILNPGAQNET